MPEIKGQGKLDNNTSKGLLYQIRNAMWKTYKKTGNIESITLEKLIEEINGSKSNTR